MSETRTFTANASIPFDCAYCSGRVQFVAEEGSGALAIVHNFPTCKAYDDLDPGNSDDFVAFARAIRRREDDKIMKNARVTCAQPCAHCADEACLSCGTIQTNHDANCKGCGVLARHGLGKS